MPQLHASAALLSRCEDRSQLSTIVNPNSHKHDIGSSSPPSHKSKPPTAHKESQRFRSTPQKLPYPPSEEEFPTLCLLIDVIMSEDSHSHGPTGELCGCMRVSTYPQILENVKYQECVC
jgi:hypothetical protein